MKTNTEIRRTLAAALVAALAMVAIVPDSAQSWTKKASRSVFTLKTFAADGSLLASSNGFFVGDNGEAVSTFQPFRGAQRAIVIDAQGKEMAVDRILGANDTYDVVRFRVDTKKSVPLALAPKAGEGSTAWILPYREARQCAQGVVKKAETFNDSYAYYTLAMAMPEQAVGCPLMNDEGLVLGLMQQPASERDTMAYAVDASFAAQLALNGLSINDATLRSTGIRKDLPNDLEQANLMVYMAAAKMDSTSYAALVDDFIAKFPDAPDGYTYRAQNQAEANNFSAAAADMATAIDKAGKKDEAHFNYARLIYQKELYKADKPYADWTLDKAYAEAETAWQLNPQPVYRHLQAQVRFAQQRFADAATLLAQVNGSDLRSAETLYEASRCQEMLRDTTAQLALLDSAVATFSQPYLKEAAPYLFARAQARINASRFRDAVADLNEYETLMPTGLNDRFYYMRHQADMGGRLFQQALNDIDKAITLNPNYALYYAEKASLQVRVGRYDDAIETATACTKLDADYSDGFLFLGLAQCLKGNKADGVANLKRAKELGDNQADELIEKYAK